VNISYTTEKNFRTNFADCIQFIRKQLVNEDLQFRRFINYVVTSSGSSLNDKMAKLTITTGDYHVNAVTFSDEITT
jgi:hypothetical protein